MRSILATLIIASAVMLAPAHAETYLEKSWRTAAAVGEVYSAHCRKLTVEQLGQISAILGFESESLQAVELIDRKRKAMGDAAFCARVQEQYGDFVDALPATR